MRAHTLVILSHLLPLFLSCPMSFICSVYQVNHIPRTRSKGYFKRVFCAPATTAPGLCFRQKKLTSLRGWGLKLQN